ncbi:MAG: HD-GYP domain-containing protein, partial [Lachnospira sp.]
MITRRLVRTRQLKEGMKIDQSVVDRAGRNLVQKGSILDNYVIESLLRMGIMMVYIQTGEESDDDIEKSISPQARKQIERLRTDDRSKVELSNSVKTRVAEGIQYIYANAESDQLADTTNNIASNLMTAINDNDAIAIDINALKTSDEYTFKHSVDVATMSMILAKQQGLSQKQIYEIGVAGLLHDIGKTKIPLEILNKPGKLTDDEFAVMKQHPVFGY